MLSAQLQTALQEADPARDRAYRQEAEAFYDKLSAWLKRHDSMKKYRDIKYGQVNTGTGEKKDVYSYEVTPKHLGVSRKYPNFFVTLSPFRTGTARYGKAKKGRRIILPILTVEVLESESGPEMARYLGYIREIFIHEFIHYLDDIRYVVPGWAPASAKVVKDGGQRAYYNSPVEFNAYFQGGAFEVEKRVAELEPGEFSRLFGRSFKKFRKHYESLFNKNFRRMIKDKWKKKYEVRLWQLYQDMLERDRGGA